MTVKLKKDMGTHKMQFSGCKMKNYILSRIRTKNVKQLTREAKSSY